MEPRELSYLARCRCYQLVQIRQRIHFWKCIALTGLLLSSESHSALQPQRDLRAV